MTFPYDPIENSRIGLLEGEIKKTRVSLAVLRHRVAFREKRERGREKRQFSPGGWNKGCLSTRQRHRCSASSRVDGDDNRKINLHYSFKSVLVRDVSGERGRAGRIGA